LAERKPQQVRFFGCRQGHLTRSRGDDRQNGVTRLLPVHADLVSLYVLYGAMIGQSVSKDCLVLPANLEEDGFKCKVEFSSTY
jgi:hypothetical protein